MSLFSKVLILLSLLSSPLLAYAPKICILDVSLLSSVPGDPKRNREIILSQINYRSSFTDEDLERFERLIQLFDLASPVSLFANDLQEALWQMRFLNRLFDLARIAEGSLIEKSLWSAVRARIELIPVLVSAYGPLTNTEEHRNNLRRDSEAYLIFQAATDTSEQLRLILESNLPLKEKRDMADQFIVAQAISFVGVLDYLRFSAAALPSAERNQLLSLYESRLPSAVRDYIEEGEYSRLLGQLKPQD